MSKLPDHQNIERLRNLVKECHEEVSRNFSFCGGNPNYFGYKGARDAYANELKLIDPHFDEFWKSLK